MGSKKAHKGPHKYHRVDFALSKVWACALPECTHYMPKHMEAMLEGKKSLCWVCNEEMILDDVNMQDDRPVHHTCKDTGIKATDIEHLADILKG